MHYGTSHFYSFLDAYLYFKEYGCNRREVQNKINEGSIHIGQPKVKPDQQLYLNTKEMRYFIIENK